MWLVHRIAPLVNRQKQATGRYVTIHAICSGLQNEKQVRISILTCCFVMVDRQGFEPWTLGLRGQCVALDI